MQVSVTWRSEGFEEFVLIFLRIYPSSLQKIPDYSQNENTIEVFAKCDDFSEGLCKRLGVTIPPFVLHRRAQVVTEETSAGQGIKVSVTGLDVDENIPYSFIKVFIMILKQTSSTLFCVYIGHSHRVWRQQGGGEARALLHCSSSRVF